MLRHNEAGIQGYFLGYYIPSRKDTTPFSDLLLKFKTNESESIVNLFCEWACKELSKEDIRLHIILRALCHNETEVSGNASLDKLGNELAMQLNSDYNPWLLKKKQTTFPLKEVELDKRELEVHNVYRCVSLPKLRSILIIDDIYTTGATTREIIRVIKLTNPDSVVYIFTLGKTG